jgi:hypothetical protein
MDAQEEKNAQTKKRRAPKGRLFCLAGNSTRRLQQHNSMKRPIFPGTCISQSRFSGSDGHSILGCVGGGTSRCARS